MITTENAIHLCCILFAIFRPRAKNEIRVKRLERYKSNREPDSTGAAITAKDIKTEWKRAS